MQPHSRPGGLAWPVALAVAATAAILALAGCSAPFPDSLAGTVIKTEQGPSTDDRERWITTVFLDQGQVLGSADVQVAFWAEDLRCDDGEAVPDGPAGLVVGTRLTISFDPDAPIDASDPPTVNGLRLEASCSPE